MPKKVMLGAAGVAALGAGIYGANKLRGTSSEKVANLLARAASTVAKGVGTASTTAAPMAGTAAKSVSTISNTANMMNKVNPVKATQFPTQHLISPVKG
jgi:hypothetical protein